MKFNRFKFNNNNILSISAFNFQFVSLFKSLKTH